MKNQITQFTVAIVAFVALTFLMSYTRPSAEQASQYIIVSGDGNNDDAVRRNVETTVNQKLSEGWHLQGGVGYGYTQAMVK